MTLSSLVCWSSSHSPPPIPMEDLVPRTRTGMVKEIHPDFEELCNVLGRYIDFMLRSASVLCVDFMEEEAGKGKIKV